MGGNGSPVGRSIVCPSRIKILYDRMSLVQVMVIWISRKSEGSCADPPASRALSLLQQSAVRAVSSEQLHNMQQTIVQTAMSFSKVTGPVRKTCSYID